MLRWLCAIVLLQMGASGWAASLTPQDFQRYLIQINSDPKKADDQFYDFSEAVGTEAYSAQQYLIAKFERKNGNFKEAEAAIQKAFLNLQQLAQQKNRQLLFSLKLSDVISEKRQLESDMYMQLPVIDEKIMRQLYTQSLQLNLVTYDGRYYAGEEREFRILNVKNFCELARKIYPQQTKTWQGQVLKLEHNRATYRNRTIYDFCDTKLAAQNLRNDIAPKLYQVMGRPLSWVGPLFSYVRQEGTELNADIQNQIVAYDLKSQMPARLKDWFDPATLQLPCSIQDQQVQKLMTEPCEKQLRLSQDQFSILGYDSNKEQFQLRMQATDRKTQQEVLVKIQIRLKSAMKIWFENDKSDRFFVDTLKL